MGALRAYLEQLQDALGEQLAQAGGGAAAAGGAAATAGGAAAGGADGAGLPLAAALDAFFGGLGAAGAGGAAGAAGGVASHEGKLGCATARWARGILLVWTQQPLVESVLSSPAAQ